MNKPTIERDVVLQIRRDGLPPVPEAGHGPPPPAPRSPDSPVAGAGSQETAGRLRHIAAQAGDFTSELDRLRARLTIPPDDDTTELAATLDQAAAAAQDLAVTAGAAAKVFSAALPTRISTMDRF